MCIYTRFAYIALRRSCIRTNHISKKLWRPEGKIEELPRTRLRMPCRARLRAFMSSLLRGFWSLRSRSSFCIVVSYSRLEQLLRMQSKFERKWISISFEYQAISISKEPVGTYRCVRFVSSECAFSLAVSALTGEFLSCIFHWFGVQGTDETN